MKKLTIAVVLLMLVSFAFADVVEPSISGSASVTVGYDLGTSLFGIENANSSSLSITLIDTQDAVKDGTAAIYGEIQLNGFGITLGTGSDRMDLITDGGDDDGAEGDADEIDPINLGTIFYEPDNDGIEEDDFVGVESPYDLTVTAPSIVAMIVGDTWNVRFDSAPGVEFANKVAGIADGAEPVNTTLLGNDSLDGFLLSLDLSGTAISVGYIMEENYTDDADTDDDGMAVTVGVSTSFDPVTIGLDAGMSFGDEDFMGVGVTVGLSLGVASVNIAFDYQSEGSTTVMEMGAGVSADLGIATIGLDAAMLQDFDVIDMQVTVGLNPMDALSVTVAAKLLNITVDLTYDVDLTIGYTVSDQVSVSVATGYNTAEELPLTITVTMTEFIENITFELKFDSGNLTADDVDGTITFATSIAY